MTLPAGQPIARVLAALFHKQRDEAMARIRAGQGPPSLTKWLRPMVDALTPLVTPLFAQGGRASAARLKKLIARKRRRRKNAEVPVGDFGGLNSGGRGPGRFGATVHGVARLGLPHRLPAAGGITPHLRPRPGEALRGSQHAVLKDAPRTPRLVFDLLHPGVEDAISHLTFSFCSETLATSQYLLADAWDALRAELLGGLQEGEAIPKLAKRVATIFDTPRAVTIARTEASRAVHAGGLQMAKQSGVVGGLKWMTANDGCEICKPLSGKVVKLGEDFAFDPKAPAAYQHVKHPPRHVNCRCSVAEELSPEWL